MILVGMEAHTVAALSRTAKAETFLEKFLEEAGIVISRKFKSTFLSILIAVLLMFVTGQAALAGLAQVGPTDLVTGFPA
jgi:hypothetical protein